MARWGAYRLRGRQPTLRARLCVPCQSERPFRGLRCVVCGTKEPALSKFGNVREGGYDSKGEKGRHEELLWLESQGVISGLVHHPPAYRLEVNGVLITTYRPDYTYVQNGRLVVEDWKGWPSDTWPLKKRLMLAIHGIEVKETGPGAGRR